MDNKSTGQRKMVRVSLMVAMMVAFAWGAPGEAVAQANSDAQKPYIMILMDTSASMEWTDEGDEEYPNNDPDGYESGTKEWKAGKEIFPDNENAYGPCQIWAPSCSAYERPHWQLEEDWTEAYNNDTTMSTRLSDMRDDEDGPRLKDSSQPRHVTLKEILTGDMVMRRDTHVDNETAIENIDPLKNGPGCWFVPRQRDASAQDEQVCENDADEFEKYPDYNEPRPHFQEIHDGQRKNGLMDTVAGKAIFAVAMFDGYKDELNSPVKDWDAKYDSRDAQNLNDPMNDTHVFAGLTEGKGNPDKAEEKEFHYNLGVFQILSPNDLDMTTSVANEVSTFVQVALADAGFLSVDDIYLEAEEDDSGSGLPGIGDPVGGLPSFSDEIEDYLADYHLGRQPMARATPLSAAIYDIHHFFVHGRKGKDYKESPILEDPYKACRPKHVVMVTDGYPEPEKGGLQVGGNTLNAAFGYDPDQYPYSSSEEAIRLFVNDFSYDDGNSRETDDDKTYIVDDWSTDEGLRFNPRVHIVGLQVGAPDDGKNEDLETEAIKKLAEMAMEGKTCAGGFLDDLKPDTYCEAGSGCCDPDSEVCLDPRQAAYMSGENYTYTAPDGTESDCLFPALILTKNDRTTLAAVFQRLFNSILSDGVSSRTRPTFVNRLDDPDVTSPTDQDDPQGGQYRVFSGVEIDGNNPYWRGLLFRETLLCVDSDGTVEDNDYLALHDQIDDIAGDVDDDGNVSDDRRRIFTTFPTDTVYDYEAHKGSVVETVSSTGTRFVFRMDLQEGASGKDEFGDGYLDAAPEALVDRRIPFEHTRLKDALDNLGFDSADYFQVENFEALEALVHEVRGRVELKENRALGAILNSSPVAVGPPDLNLPVDSYRAYKTLFEDRPSMLYFATTDGMLHGVYSGELEDEDGSDDEQVKERGATSPSGAGSGTETDGSMHNQREAWAYIPQMLHNDLSLNRGQQPYLMDGTPSVKDVRLCHKAQSHNQNKQACRYDCTSEECFNRAADSQWRTVLVSGLGEAGSGYFALDVTRPGGLHTSGSHSGIQVPDPIPLWEFDPNWERGQVEEIGDAMPGLVYPQDSSLRSGGDFIDECSSLPSDDNYFWDQPFMGRSVAEAAIGTVAIHDKYNNSGDRLRRPVAVFSGGEAGEFGTSCDREERSGRAIYVVDLQTGTLLRRFVSYTDPDDGSSDEYRFEQPVSGSPALYDGFPGSLATRGFVGDEQGRLFRIDLSSDDPLDWSVDLFFDPAEDIDWDSTPDKFGAASYKPAIALGSQATDKDLLIYYGLGVRGDLNVADQAQLMIALREEIEVDIDTNDKASASATGSLLWHVEFEGLEDSDAYVEKLTGAPVVFNKGVYFTSFVEPKEDRCEPGWSRIYGMKFEGTYDPDNPGELTDPPRPYGAIVDPPSGDSASTKGGWGKNVSDGDKDDDAYWYYEPSSAPSVNESVIVRGLAVTLGPSCSSDPAQTGGGMAGSDSSKPTLVAQTSSGAMPGDKVHTDVNGPALTSIEHELPDPQSQDIPLSWSVIDN